MHTMDFTGEYLDYVLSVDLRQTSPSGENNVNIQLKSRDNESFQQWVYDSETKSIRSLYFDKNKALDYDPNKSNNLIVSYFDRDDKNQKFVFNTNKNELFNIGTQMVVEIDNDRYVQGNNANIYVSNDTGAQNFRISYC